MQVPAAQGLSRGARLSCRRHGQGVTLTLVADCHLLRDVLARSLNARARLGICLPACHLEQLLCVLSAAALRGGRSLLNVGLHLE